MRKQHVRTFLLLCLFLFSLFIPRLAYGDETMTAYCDDANDPLGLECVRDSGLSDQDPRIVISRIINVSLGLLGIIATVLILYAGFRWMTAGGNSESVDTARKTLFAAVIGLIIILSAYAISNFVLRNLARATTGVQYGNDILH
ncbi:MAG TPA: hypothetical protein DCS29_01980 [Candidatus Magasanikbacteria bacterium]|nr:hypothetical protein [Candidatus Magasanikbacteria bacterium]